MRLGLERTGWATKFANDIDPLKHQIYAANFGIDEHFYLCDIHCLSSSDLPTVTLATASFPCTDLSLAGARAGLDGKQSSAFWGFVRCLQLWGHRKPPIVLLENVPGFLTSNQGQDFRDAALALNSLGYYIDAFILDAVNFVPQSRQRLFVVGKQKQATSSSDIAPNDLIEQSQIRPKALVAYIKANSDIHWSISPLPSPLRLNHHLSHVIDPSDHESQEWWSSDRANYLLNQMSELHAASAKSMMSEPKWSYGTVFRRVRNGRSMAELRTDGIAGCLRTPKGGSGRQILFKAGFGQFFARLLSPAECARLMGADGFIVDVPLNQALFGFGDAVCVPVVEWIAKNYFENTLRQLGRRTSQKRRATRELVYA